VTAAIDLNHVSVCATDLETSIRFYEEVLGLERIATPNFGFPVQWLRAGQRQIHLFQRPGSGPQYHHFGLTVEDIEGVYERAKAFGCLDGATFQSHLVELPGDVVQLYLRDPAGNLVELDAAGASSLPESIQAELVKLADVFPQSHENLRGRLHLS
jgi:catechol 2,3-dioxygenase-like lactoylglutathione lyase family enzyme